MQHKEKIMKKIFLTFLFFCTSIAYAASEPVFEETDGDDHHNKVHGSYFLNANYNRCMDEDEDQYSLPYTGFGEDKWNAGPNSWKRYAATFGVEKVIVRFPHPPNNSVEDPYFVASSSDGAVAYYFHGKCPPKPQVEPISWFTEKCVRYNEYPFSLYWHNIQENTNGNWTMDYIAHDFVNDMIYKGHATVTPFNVYSIECIKPSGSLDFFKDFLENFSIKCNCECSY